MKRWWTDDSGATAVEYGLIALFIVVAIMSTMHVMGAELLVLYTKISTGVTTAAGM